ncbi:sigma-70 RNA polymerase sigma factor region 4 domain-containing protein [Desulfosporosinus fructosivorans]
MCEQLKVLELNVQIRNRLLFQALKTLNEVKRDIMLMSFRLGMKDAEIADKLGFKHRNINRVKLSTHEKIRIFLAENEHKPSFFVVLRYSVGCHSPPLVLHF